MYTFQWGFIPHDEFYWKPEVFRKETKLFHLKIRPICEIKEELTLY